MKKLLLIAIFIASPLIGQEMTEAQIEQDVYDRKSRTPMFLFGNYMFSMTDDKDSKDDMLLNSDFEISFEINANISFNPHLYSAFVYYRIGSYFPLDNPHLLKMAAGVSGYIYNGKNKDTYLGYSVMMGAGGVIHHNFHNESSDVGYELFLRTQYNFHKYVGVVMGVSFEHFYAINDLWDEEFSYLDNNIHIFKIGAMVGIAF